MERHVQIQRIRIPVEWQAMILADADAGKAVSRSVVDWRVKAVAFGLVLVVTGCLLPGL